MGLVRGKKLALFNMLHGFFIKNRGFIHSASLSAPVVAAAWQLFHSGVLYVIFSQKPEVKPAYRVSMGRSHRCISASLPWSGTASPGPHRAWAAACPTPRACAFQHWACLSMSNAWHWSPGVPTATARLTPLPWCSNFCIYILAVWRFSIYTIMLPTASAPLKQPQWANMPKKKWKRTWLF